MLIDTHCHLDMFAAYKLDKNVPQDNNPELLKGVDYGDIDLVLQRAEEVGVNYFINIGATIESSFASCELAKRYPEVYSSVGVHPHDAETFDIQIENKLRELAQGSKVVAIGEIGLDYYRNLSTVDKQRQAFSRQIKLAKELNKPLVIHSREAEKEAIQILKAAMPVRAVIHCFSGDESVLKQCLDCGFFISYTCNITYKKAQNLRAMVKLTPLDRLMLETDAPYLSPEGFRGKRNEPLQIKLLAEEVSKIKAITFDELADKTTQNAKGFFGLL
ncbi:MAG: TatD family hydrolase [Candidatus Omnitrophota bacterium]